MPYNIDKKKCKQSDGDSGTHVLSYTDGKGKDHDNCHTSKKGAQGQIAAIEGDNLAETDDMVFGGGGDPEAEGEAEDGGMDEALLREWIRQRLLLEQAALDEPTLLSVFKSLGFDKTKKYSSKRMAVLVDGPGKMRSKALGDIEAALKDYGAVWDKSPVSVSSLGMVKAGPFSILAKPASRQGGMSAGLENEEALVKAVNTLAADQPEGINVKFVGSGAGEFLVKGVTKAISAGADTKGRKKSDVNLITTGGNVPISIKKDNAQYWESADSYYGASAAEKLKELEAAGEVEMVDKGGYYNVVPNIAVPASAAEVIDVVFGSDILGNGAVIKKSFSDSDFVYDAETNILTVASTYIITDPSHVTGDYSVWFLIRNDKTRKSVPGYPGIRVLAAYEKRINTNVKRVDESKMLITLVRLLLKESESQVRDVIHEALSASDKSEIKRIFKKEMEKSKIAKKIIKQEIEAQKKATQTMVDKSFKKNFDKELRAALGASFFGTPGKINKFVIDEIQAEVQKMLGDKATKEIVVQICKDVIIKLYRELSFSYPQVIQRIKV